MKIEVVQATNFLSHVDSTLAPNGARFMTIRGDHGVGKTAMVEAIGYGLFNRGRFATADEPVRLGATDMSVRVEWLSPDGQRYRVIRRRTTKAGGKGSLNFALQRADGGWTSLDGDSIRATEAAIRDVVGVDGPTFEAIAFLMQGRITALVEATASGRRDVLVAGLLLDLWPKAATRARKEATELEANLAAERDQLGRIEEVLGKLPDLEAVLAGTREALARHEADVVEHGARRDRLDARIRELDAALADAGRLQADIARLERDRGAIAEDWRRARDRENGARGQIGRLTALLADADEVNAAATALPPMKARLEDLVAAQRVDQEHGDSIHRAEVAIVELRRPHDAAVTTWRVRHEAAAAKVAELEAHGKAGASVCEACGQPIGQDTALEQLAARRRALKALGDEPTAPLAIAREEAKLTRLHDRRRELAFTPATLVALQAEVTRASSIAARADDLARAQEQLVRETATATEADAEKARLAERGQAIAGEVAALQVKLAEAEPFREERRVAGEAMGRAVAVLEASQGRVRQLVGEVAGAEAHLAQLKDLEADAERISEVLAAGATESALLRRLVGGFGEIPLRIIDASLPELEAEAQGLLDVLDPGATVTISAQRATVDGKRIVSAIDITYTDGAGARDVRMTSGGERVAVSVALSLGLRRVLARQHGARLETAFIDEPDGLDGLQRRALADASRALVNTGDLALMGLITHHEDLAEAGDTQYLVSKNGTGSVLELVT